MQLVSGVQHAGEVLRLFSPSEPEWGAADVGRTLAISKSHAHRLLSTLAQIGLLDRLDVSGRFRLSWTWFSYTSVLFASDRLVKAGLPILRTLNSAYGVESMLAVWECEAILTLRPALVPVVTRTEPEDSMTVGLVLMAGLTDDELDELVSRRSAHRGFPERAKVDRFVRHIRFGGALTRAGAGGAGWLAAAPVMDSNRKVVAALAASISGLSPFTERQVADMVKNAARLIAASLFREAEPLGGRPSKSTAVWSPAPPDPESVTHRDVGVGVLPPKRNLESLRDV